MFSGVVLTYLTTSQGLTMPRGKLHPSVALTKLLAVRLNERNYALIHFGARRAGMKISEFVRNLIRTNVKVRLPRQPAKKAKKNGKH